MNTRIQPQIEIELTDEQLASVSGGFGHDEGHGHDDHRGHWGDHDDRRGWGHHRGHWDRWHHWCWDD